MYSDFSEPAPQPSTDRKLTTSDESFAEHSRFPMGEVSRKFRGWNTGILAGTQQQATSGLNADPYPISGVLRQSWYLPPDVEAIFYPEKDTAIGMSADETASVSPRPSSLLAVDTLSPRAIPQIISGATRSFHLRTFLCSKTCET